MSEIIQRTVPITRDTIVDNSAKRNLGTSMITLPEGKALCTDAVSLTIITAADDKTGERFLVVVAVADFDGRHLGSLSPMTPTEARNFAASLIQGANDIESVAELN